MIKESFFVRFKVLIIISIIILLLIVDAFCKEWIWGFIKLYTYELDGILNYPKEIYIELIGSLGVILAATFSIYTFKRQDYNKYITNERIRWLVDMKETFSKIIQLGTSIALSASLEDDFKDNVKKIDKCLELTNYIILNLNSVDEIEYIKKLKKYMDILSNLVVDFESHQEIKQKNVGILMEKLISALKQNRIDKKKVEWFTDKFTKISNTFSKHTSNLKEDEFKITDIKKMIGELNARFEILFKTLENQEIKELKDEIITFWDITMDSKSIILESRKQEETLIYDSVILFKTEWEIIKLESKGRYLTPSKKSKVKKEVRKEVESALENGETI